MTTRTRLVLFLALLIISVATLLQAISDNENQGLYALSTVVSHIALFGVGFWYNQGRQEKRNAWRKQLREDVLGE